MGDSVSRSGTQWQIEKCSRVDGLRQHEDLLFR